MFLPNNSNSSRKIEHNYLDLSMWNEVGYNEEIRSATGSSDVQPMEYVILFLNIGSGYVSMLVGGGGCLSVFNWN